MRVLLDTSTLVAAMLPDHAHHVAAYAWVAQGKMDAFEFIVSAHSLAETYAVLTRLPRKPRVTPSDAWRLLQENVVSHADLVTLSGSQYAMFIDDLSKQGVLGGAVYDALITRAAEQARVDQLVTLNVEDFRRVWPGGAQRVVSPLSLAPPSSES